MCDSFWGFLLYVCKANAIAEFLLPFRRHAEHTLYTQSFKVPSWNISYAKRHKKLKKKRNQKCIWNNGGAGKWECQQCHKPWPKWGATVNFCCLYFGLIFITNYVFYTRGHRLRKPRPLNCSRNMRAFFTYLFCTFKLMKSQLGEHYSPVLTTFAKFLSLFSLTGESFNLWRSEHSNLFG